MISVIQTFSVSHGVVLALIIIHIFVENTLKQNFRTILAVKYAAIMPSNPAVYPYFCSLTPLSL